MDPEILTTTTVRDRLYEVIDAAEDGDVFIIVGRDEKPKAVLIGAEDYERLMDIAVLHGIRTGQGGEG